MPLLCSLPARVGGLGFEAMNQDPALWTNALARTADLFDLDGLVIGADPTLLAEACGCPVGWEGGRPVVTGPAAVLSEAPEKSGRMSACLETARRAFQVGRARRGCVAAVTGPVTLASQLFGLEEGPGRLADAKQRVTAVVESYCAQRPDLLVFVEGDALGGEVTAQQRRAYNTLKNVASYYNIPTALFVQDYDPSETAQLAALKMDLYLLGPGKGGGFPSPCELPGLGEGTLAAGVCLPLDDASSAREFIQEWKALSRSGKARGLFFTSFEPATGEIDLDVVHGIVREIRAVSL